MFSATRPRCLANIRPTFSVARGYVRQLSTRQEDDINYNRGEFSWEGSTNSAQEAELATYPCVTADTLSSGSKPPQKVKMLVRDFIQDSLYNPQYGYFSKRATIFSPKTQIPFRELPETAAFQEAVAQLYAEYSATNQAPTYQDGPGKQVWHTPTELFKPFYGHAIARCLVSEYLLKYYPYEDLIIYEIGAGNGTLALNILDFLRESYPDVYDRTQYHIIEISGRLSKIQAKTLQNHSLVKFNQKDIFSWDTMVAQPCFFLALEVVDNFPHDILRYSADTLQPYQGLIALGDNGSIQELYEPAWDPLILRYSSYRQSTSHRPGPLKSPLLRPAIRKLRRLLPLAPNLTKPEYVPTKLLAFLELLAEKFPLHRLLLSDFSSLKDTVEGFNAPVVQTRVKNTMVPCSTIAVHPGYFDIFFPTDFELLRDMYEIVLARPHGDNLTRPSPMSTTASPLRLGADYFSSKAFKYGRRSPLDGLTSTSGLPVGQRQSIVYTHKEFMKKYADVSTTTLRNGDNPMLEFYQNVKFLF